MIHNPHRFVVEFRTPDGRPLGQETVEEVWAAACEWARFACLRKEGRAVSAAGSRMEIEPVADGQSGLPYASGFRVIVSSGPDRLGQAEFPLTYFSRQALAASARLVGKGLLAQGDKLRYRLLAFPVTEPAVRTAPPGLEMDEVEQPLPLKRSSFAALTAQASAFGEETPEDIPIFMPQQVIEEANELTTQAGAAETGGILLGHLHRDESLPDVGVVVTAQVPARLAEGELDKLTFTPDTWAAVRAATALRKSDELMVGWWHSHPAKFWCSPQCPPERRRECPLTRDFFSEDDQCLHETVFNRAFQVAMVVTHTDDGLKQALFGWRAGTIRRRGFKILKGDRACAAVEEQLGDSHAKACT